MSVVSDEEQEVAPHRLRAEAEFKRQIGVNAIDSTLQDIGTQTFLSFVVGRKAPVYERALRRTRKALEETNLFRGLLALDVRPADNFPTSLEADVLLNTITRSTRHIAGTSEDSALSVPFVSFQNKEDERVTQPATHLIVGRRGVGKSTLITRAVQLLNDTPALCVIVDMQAYSEIYDDSLFVEVLADVSLEIAKAIEAKSIANAGDGFRQFSERIRAEQLGVGRAVAELKRMISAITMAQGAGLYVFLDDYHLVDQAKQPHLLNLLHAASKGANGWLKVAGLQSLLRHYDPTSRQGLQIPGDAQRVSLDLTLVNPETAEEHLRTILVSFLQNVGIQATTAVIHEPAFQRLVWANAGVPRDFLQMFGRALERARQSDRPKVTLTDTNLAIGESGQQKMDELEQDARNERNLLRKIVSYLERYCLEEKKINAFLVRSEHSREREAIQTLSDLRIVHLIHPTITPHKAGQRYEAYLLDYSLYTGFRRRPNIREMLPESGSQFKAGELRKLPALPLRFISDLDE